MTPEQRIAALIERLADHHKRAIAAQFGWLRHKLGLGKKPR